MMTYTMTCCRNIWLLIGIGFTLFLTLDTLKCHYYYNSIQQQQRLDDLQIKIKQLAHELNMDSLTNVYNRRYFDHQLVKLVNITQEQQQQPSSQPQKLLLFLLLIDIDNFKGVNDKFGHQSGDQVITAVAAILKSYLTLLRPRPLHVHREEENDLDFIARYGGEEFAIIILVTQQNLTFVKIFAEELRQLIDSTMVKLNFNGNGKGKGNNNTQIHVTISIGITQLKISDKPKDLLSRADKALYKAKENGKNKVEVNF